MTESESMLMVAKFRDAWPDDDTTDATQTARLFAAYATEVVESVIEDRIEAELGRPSLADLSRVLRAYAPGAKTDVDPTPPQRPQTPWVRDMPALPPQPENLTDCLAELRDALSVGTGLFDARPRTAPEPAVKEFTIIPPSVREALVEGVKAGAVARQSRQAEALAELGRRTGAVT